MRKPFIYCIALLGVILAGCAEEPEPLKETCYVSILPIRYIVQEIVGPDLNIEVPPGPVQKRSETLATQTVRQAPTSPAGSFNVGPEWISRLTSLLAVKSRTPPKSST